MQRRCEGLASYLELLLALWNLSADSGHLGKADKVKVARVCQIALHNIQLVSACVVSLPFHEQFSAFDRQSLVEAHEQAAASPTCSAQKDQNKGIQVQCPTCLVLKGDLCSRYGSYSLCLSFQKDA